MSTKTQAAENAAMARADRAKLEQVGVRIAKALQELEGPQFTPAFREAQRTEIHATAGTEAAAILARLRERVTVAARHLEESGAEHRRMMATIAHPVEAQALRARFDQVSLGELMRLAREAAARGDYLAADAILTSRSVTTADHTSPEVVSLLSGLQATCDAMEQEPREQVELLAREVGNHFVAGEVLAAEVSGRPLTSVAKLSLAHSHETAAVGAAA